MMRKEEEISLERLRGARWRALPLGEKVKVLRERRGLNQSQLAVASGITQATISRLESGGVKNLSSERLKSLAGALQVSTDLLLGSPFADSIDNARDLYQLTPNNSETSLEGTLQYLIAVYQKLSDFRRNELRDFARFLEEQEDKSGEERIQKAVRGLFKEADDDDEGTSRKKTTPG